MGLDMDLRMATLKNQVPAISAFSVSRWANHELVVHSFRAAWQIRPPQRLHYPKWDLPLVPDFFFSAIFQPDSQPTLYPLSLRTAFLVAVTSASRVSVIAALGAHELFLLFGPLA